MAKSTRRRGTRPPTPTAAATSPADPRRRVLPTHPGFPKPPDPEHPPAGIWTAEEIRRDSSYLYELPTRRGKFFRLLRADGFDMLMRGVVPMALLKSAEKITAFTDALKKRPAGFTDISEEEKAEQMTILRDYARQVVIEPKLVDADDGDPTHLDIHVLTYWDLLAISNASPTRATPRLSEADADRFRQPPAVARADGAAAPVGESVQDAPVVVHHNTGADFLGG